MSWQDGAACRGMDTLLFFGPDHEARPEREIREAKAKAVCTLCPVRVQCLDFALIEILERFASGTALERYAQHTLHLGEPLRMLGCDEPSEGV